MPVAATVAVPVTATVAVPVPATVAVPVAVAVPVTAAVVPVAAAVVPVVADRQRPHATVEAEPDGEAVVGVPAVRPRADVADAVTGAVRPVEADDPVTAGRRRGGRGRRP